MKHRSIALSTIAVLAVSLVFASCTSMQAQLPVRTIEVVGTGEVELEPDFATFSIQVSETGKTTSEAQSLANAKLSQLLQYLSDGGVDEQDISTTTLTLRPQYEWDDGKQILVGQLASQRLSVKMRDLDSLGSLIDTLGMVTGIQLDSVSFDSGHKDAAKQEARQKAVADALAKAKVYAESCGMTVGKPVTISESSFNEGNYLVRAKTLMASGASMEMDSTVVPAGSLTVSADISMVLELL